MTALATAAILALPYSSLAQTPPPSSPPPASQPPSAAPDAQSPPAQDAARQPAEDGARKHLTQARDALSQLTQLPAAAQLSGDARTQVSQLITNFNELITTQSNWRAAYAKVDANLTALLGPASSGAEDAPATPVPAGGGAPPAGVAGTSGTAALDPAIRAKLVEVRTHLSAFNEATGSPSSAAPSAAPSAPTSPTTPPPSAAPAGSPPAAAPDKPASAPPAAPPAAAPDSPKREAAAAAAPPAAAPAASDAMRHIEAIEAILGGGAAAPGAKASTARATVTAAQIEQIRQHLNELKKTLEK
jgi:hypothetical protein